MIDGDVVNPDVTGWDEDDVLSHALIAGEVHLAVGPCAVVRESNGVDIGDGVGVGSGGHADDHVTTYGRGEGWGHREGDAEVACGLAWHVERWGADSTCEVE